MTNDEVNNASVSDALYALVEAKSLEVFDFFENPNDHDKASDWGLQPELNFLELFIFPLLSYVIPLDEYIPKKSL